jgi:hypothetical protein
MTVTVHLVFNLEMVRTRGVAAMRLVGDDDNGRDSTPMTQVIVSGIN